MSGIDTEKNREADMMKNYGLNVRMHGSHWRLQSYVQLARNRKGSKSKGRRVYAHGYATKSDALDEAPLFDFAIKSKHGLKYWVNSNMREPTASTAVDTNFQLHYLEPFNATTAAVHVESNIPTVTPAKRDCSSFSSSSSSSSSTAIEFATLNATERRVYKKQRRKVTLTRREEKVIGTMKSSRIRLLH